MNVGTWPSMAKHDDSVNRIFGRSIADIMPRSISPSTVAAHRLTGGEVDEMEPCTGRATKGFKAPSLVLLSPFEMGLHIHARLRASENDQIGHQHRMTAPQILSLI
ncbi:hypothetical protein L6654_39470 [Bradyrhizobium sp. WYCCWR 13023]|uniref:Uncharacterized protein n=1 Tax=Bradyrhizobium zhengyangense TaxID=2911009 RepID=A0A9X1UEQ3_9BRAD|nr:hypothetical protein [Bradyrhizobium zhengyangense]MCG2632684.1 hypothetical protein [Bradyrhizobium zhengyangense]MCG2672188.1 hypothetical protein [Bradyrhizobium zhengyangense]